MTDNFEFRSINPDEVEQAIAIEQGAVYVSHRMRHVLQRQ